MWGSQSGYKQACPAIRTRNKALTAIEGKPTPGDKSPLWIPSPKGNRQAGLGQGQGPWSPASRTYGNCGLMGTKHLYAKSKSHVRSRQVVRNWKWDMLSRHMRESKLGVEGTGQVLYPGLRNSIWKLKWSNGEIPLFTRCWWVVFRFLDQSLDSSETPVALDSLLSRFSSAVVAVAVVRLKFWKDLGHLHFERWSIALIQRYVKSHSVLATLILQRLFSSTCAYIYTHTEWDTGPKTAAGVYCKEPEPWTQKECKRGFILLVWHQDL